MLPDALRRNVTANWGPAGEAWLEALPRTLATVAEDWGLDVGAPFDLTFHYVCAATLADGTPVVLKLGVPGGGSLAMEAAALDAFGGLGAVHLLRHDLELGALLVERAVPGERVRDLPDAEATSAVAGVMRLLHAPAPAGCRLPEVGLQARSFDGYLARFPDGGPLPREHVVRAAGLMRELCASAPARVLLHGDLHHDNVLRGTRAPWLAIDPHGLVGDPSYEAGSLLYNPVPEVRSAALLGLVRPRLEQLADRLGYPIERLAAWGYVKGVLSDVWSAEGWRPGASWTPHSRGLDVALLLHRSEV